jgi:hypothetical protein
MHIYPIKLNNLLRTIFCCVVGLLSLIALQVNSKVSDCKNVQGKAYSQCLRQTDVANEKVAKPEKPQGKYYRTLGERQKEREDHGRPRDDKLHFGKQKPVSGTQAAKSNGYGSERKPPEGYIECEFKPTTNMKDAKVAGGHGNKHEHLVDARDVRKDCKGAKFHKLSK